MAKVETVVFKWKDHLFRAPRPATFALEYNNSAPPFDKKEVRQAFGMAVDRDAFINTIRIGVGSPAYSWIPPQMPGYDPNLGKDVFKLDPAKARQLLAQAGYPDG
jgi:oligopeptide transport system substrate-binding protein